MGEILDFPRDTERRKLFPKGHSEHQAKLEIRTFKWLVEQYTKPGDIILDPMSGVGTVHVAATMGRHTIAIELVPRFVELQWEAIQKLDEVLGINATPVVLEGDCRRWLPIKAGQITELAGQIPTICIFSPPYGSLWKSTDSQKESKFLQEKHYNIGYDDHIQNVGNITIYPVYLNAMREIYRLVNKSLPMGALLISVVKDYIKNYERIQCTMDNLRVMTQVGFATEDWHKRYTDPRLNQIIHKKRREALGRDRIDLNVDYEDILVMKKVMEVE